MGSGATAGGPVRRRPPLLQIARRRSVVAIGWPRGCDLRAREPTPRVRDLLARAMARAPAGQRADACGVVAERGAPRPRVPVPQEEPGTRASGLA